MADEDIVIREWQVEYSFDPETGEGVRREWKQDELVEERPAHLSELTGGKE